MKEKLARNPLPVIFFTIFVDLIGFGVLIPIIPQLLANPASEFFLLPRGFTLNDGYILLGYLLAVFPFMQFLATPIFGEISDTFGRKKVLVIPLIGSCLSYLLFAMGILMKNIPLLFISRSFAGLTGSNVSVAQAAIADITTPENRAKNFGLIGAAFGLGFIIGPYIGGKLSDPHVISWFNAATPFWFSAGLSFLNVLSVIFFFPETLKQRKAELNIHLTKSIQNIIKAYSLPDLRTLFLSNFLFQAGFTFFTTFSSVFLINRFHFTQGNVGDFFSYVGVWIAFSQAVVTRRVASKLSGPTILRFSMIGAGIFVLLYFLPTIWWQLLLITPFFAIFNGLTQANIAGVISGSVDRHVQGETLGINSSVQALAQTIPPVLSGYIAAQLTPVTPIFISGIVIILAGIFFNIFYKPAAKKTTPEAIAAA